ncbi:MAG: hypothetical protein LUG18_03920 [Candidatus Azobacteroides sp.]|nr:hypothetical protein [Candidatus Azobacteroides sp.]
MKLFYLFFILLATWAIPAFSQEASQQCSFLKHSEPVWNAEYMEDQWFLVRGTGVDSIKNDIHALVEAWNELSDIDVSLIEIKTEYVHIAIPESDRLTQSSGTSGAMVTLATLVYTLTEHPVCNHLFLDFEEGDHAEPGIYSRADFLDSFVICY